MIKSLQIEKEITGSVQAKKGKWYVVLNLYNEIGKRKPKWIPTGLAEKGNKKKAIAIKNQRIKEYSEQEEPQKEVLLFIDYAKSWYERQKENIERSTWERNKNIVFNHIIPYFKSKKLAVSEVKPAHIRDYYHYKANRGRLDGKEGGLSHSTIKNHSSVLKLIFDDALIMEEIDRNPVSNVPLKQSREDSEAVKEKIFLGTEEANYLISQFEGEVILPHVVIGLYYGLRRGEVVGLCWDAIDFDANTMTIKRSVVRHSTTEIKDRLKSKSSYATYELLPDVREMFLRVKAEQEEYRKQFGREYHKSHFCFTWQDGRMIQPDYLYKRFVRVLELKGLRKMTFHDLRHSCSSILHEKGWNAKDAQEWLRHAKLETTMNIYTHITDAHKKVLTKDLENTFKIPV